MGSFVWLMGAIVVLVFHGILWNEIARVRPLRLPETPADLTNPVYAVQWHYLMDVREWIPDGAVYTVAAQDLYRGMNLFVLSMAVYPKARGLPTTYFETRRPDLPPEARFVLDEDCQFTERAELRLLVRLPSGCVEARR